MRKPHINGAKLHKENPHSKNNAICLLLGPNHDEKWIPFTLSYYHRLCYYAFLYFRSPNHLKNKQNWPERTIESLTTLGYQFGFINTLQKF
jgi:hypothetical protein